MQKMSYLVFHWEGGVQEIRHKQEAIHSLNLLQLLLLLTLLSAFYREKKKRLHSAAATENHECLLESRKLAGINKWQTQYQMVLCIHESLKLELWWKWYYLHSNPYISHVSSKLILFNTHNICLGLHGNLTCTLWCRICKGKLLQVYDENMRLGKTTYSIKVNELQMRLPYYRIYSNTVCSMKNHKISFHKYSFYKQKSYFGCTLSDLCGVLTSRVNNLK